MYWFCSGDLGMYEIGMKLEMEIGMHVMYVLELECM